MGVEPPFIYDRPSTYTFGGPTNRSFDPKAATRASWTPKHQRPLSNGPLVDFNRHPDSYVAAPYGNLNVRSMNPNTKKKVNVAWKTQRWLRVLALLGTLGALFCVITIRKTSSTIGWIIRIGPAVALVHTFYATYFLSRRPNSRPPASAASYQLFAGLLDTGLIPFFALAAIMSYQDYMHNTYGWDTLFGENDIDYKIIKGFFIVSTTVCGLFFVSLILDVYLAVIYRKIAALPPDLNPLEEDNLTARPRHKRNKSELLHEKHLSSSTLATQRMSQMTDSQASGRRVPFTHTRTDSVDRVTLYGNEAAKQSRVSMRKEFMSELTDPYGARASMSIARENGLSRPGSAVMPAANARPVGAGLDNSPARSSVNNTPKRPTSWLSYLDYEGVPVPMSDYAQHELDQNVRPVSPVSVMSDREYPPVRASFEHDDEQHQPPSPSRQLLQSAMEAEVEASKHVDHLTPPSYESPPRKRSREPLGMNPPTPVINQFEDENLAPRPLSIHSTSTPPRPVLVETGVDSQNRPTYGSRPSSFIGSGGKTRFYGKLRSSMGPSGGHGSPRIFSYEVEDDMHRSNTVKTDDSGNFEVYGSDSDDEGTIQSVRHGQAVVVGQDSPAREWNGQRQISNSTGHDLHAGYAGLDPEFGKGMARRREVSGKVAEEGRSYTISSEASQTPPRQAAAGWARFAGL